MVKLHKSSLATSLKQLVGGTGAESLEKGKTNIFSDNSSIPLDVEDFKMKPVSCKSDGASVWSKNRSNDNVVSSTAMDDQNSLCQPSC